MEEFLLGLLKIELFSFFGSILMVLILHKVQTSLFSSCQLIPGGLCDIKKKKRLLFFINIVFVFIVIARFLLGYSLFIILMNIGTYMHDFMGLLVLGLPSFLILPTLLFLDGFKEGLEGIKPSGKKVKLTKIVTSIFLFLIIDLAVWSLCFEYYGEHNWIYYNSYEAIDYYYHKRSIGKVPFSRNEYRITLKEVGTYIEGVYDDKDERRVGFRKRNINSIKELRFNVKDYTFRSEPWYLPGRDLKGTREEAIFKCFVKDHIK